MIQLGRAFVEENLVFSLPTSCVTEQSLLLYMGGRFFRCKIPIEGGRPVEAGIDAGGEWCGDL